MLLLKSLVRKPLNNLKQGTPSTPTPTSQLAGIVALPTELWSIIIDYTVLQLINEDTPPFDELTPALNLRLVCRESLLCTKTLTAVGPTDTYSRDIQQRSPTRSQHQYTTCALPSYIIYLLAPLVVSYPTQIWPAYHPLYLCDFEHSSYNKPPHRLSKASCASSELSHSSRESVQITSCAVL